MGENTTPFVFPYLNVNILRCMVSSQESEYSVLCWNYYKVKSKDACSSVWVMIVMDSVISLFKTCVFVMTSLASTRLHVTFSLFLSHISIGSCE